MPLSQNDLNWFAARLSIAVYETKQEHRMARQTELRDKFSAPDLTVRFMGHFQIINLEGHEITIGSMATDEQIAAEIAKIRQIQGSTENPMTTIAEQLKAARAKLAEARDGAANAIAASDDASRVVLGEVNKVLKEADELRAEVAELTNGGPT